MSHPYEPLSASPDPGHTDLQSNCENCFGLCCAALPFAASADFAIDKNAGQPCPSLRNDFRCGIHTGLRAAGFRGCTVYECFGAGPRVSHSTFAGRDWREAPQTAAQMFEVFPVMRHLHELLRYLAEALALPSAQPVHSRLRTALEQTERLTLLPAEAILQVDIPAYRAEINVLLLRTSELARDAERHKLTHAPKHPKSYGRGADLIGAKLKKADLRCVSLRGAYLIAADLSGADLRGADLTGADFRDTNLCGADLTGTLFLTQSQLNAAKGDALTKLPAGLERPGHWTAW
ncbi:pentapeptide repeat-containing protein [Paenibacillus sp. S150]|uniref:pentapeptide repeat-containing protein n=1 Tax=Paenibacillus sp. S150 TaxID=2749826 RepID=UPI001C569DE2|nr:pentapeptide repeat-containing protein [Paenibacillus sp. S150]MBW4080483.1 pentapeptide repeat-containing protein [Paenibacillus sp. S150]